jgi:1-acyl-sn-glycerol-3-phosphate acyltransferase
VLRQATSHPGPRPAAPHGSAAPAAPPLPWTIWSPCTSGCPAHAAPPVPPARRLRRAAALSRTLVGALARGERLADPATLTAYARAVLTALGVTLDADGPLSAPPAQTRARTHDHDHARLHDHDHDHAHPPDAQARTPDLAQGRARHRDGPGTLIVANHISWLDVLGALAIEPVTVLAKREAGAWPVVGTLVRRAGTRFIDRDRLRELPLVVAELSALLRAGRPVMVFPQGATWCSGTAEGFRRATLQAALDAGAPVRPVTLGYAQHGLPSTVAAFVGDEGFATSLGRVLAADGLTLRVRTHQPLRPVPGADDRRELTDRAYAAVSSAAGGPEPRALG